MQRRQIRSAPVGGRPRSKKTSAISEIEEWVYSNKELVSGKSTEQRLLQAKLLELGKERFKMKSKMQYDIERFVDKQTRNGLMNKRSRPASATGYIPVETISAREKRAAMCQSAPARRSKTPLRTKTVQFPQEVGTQYLTTGITDGVDNDNTLWSRVHQNAGSFIGLQPDQNNGFPLVTELSRPSTAGATGFSRSVSTFSQDNYPRQRRNALYPRDKYGSRYPTITGDPRFSLLYKALSNNYESRTKDNVQSIIERIESLRQPLKTGSKEARRELEIKIRAFMKENNIVF